MRVQQTLTTAAGLMATVAHAAPRLAAEDTPEVRGRRAGAPRGLRARWSKWGNARMAQMEEAKDEMPEGCPTASVIISTTTVDVTVYVTPTTPANTTEPCPEEEMTTSTEPCPEETGSMWNTTTWMQSTTSEEPCPEETGGMWNTTTWMQPTTSEEPCPEETGGMWNTTTMIPMTTGPKTTKVIHISKNMTQTTEPCPEESTMTPTTTDCPEETPTSTEPCDEESTWTRHMTRTVKVTPDPTITPTTTCVIDTSMTPVSKSSMTSTPTTTVTPSTTVCEHDNPTGAPTADSLYCGIKGQPAGVYFIAEFIEDRPGVPVTEEGCYQFCDSVMEDTKGCLSYRFYPNELGAPRCDLYGMSVSHVVKDLDNYQPGKWYDLACGSPSSQMWHSDKMANTMKNAATSPNTDMKNVANDAAAAAAAAPDQNSGKLLNLKLGPVNVGM